MRKSMCVKAAFCLLLVFAVSPVCFGQVYTPQPFSADFGATSGNGTHTTGKYYFSSPRFRMDFNSQGRNVSIINDSGTQTNYIVMHDQHMYMESHSNQPNPLMRQAPFVPKDFDPKNPCVWAAQHDATCKSLGTEIVNGRLCDKYQGTSKDGKTGTGWIDQKLHFIVKGVSSDGASFEFSNIKEGKPDASLFQAPAGYRKMDLPGAMGGRPPQ